MKTQSQAMMQQALELVCEVKNKSEKVRDIYGNLCHEFPVLVRTCGLCQAIAFCADKAQSDEEARAKAYQLLLQHIGEILSSEIPGVKTDGKGGADDPLLEKVLQASTTEYMLYTRRVLQAWVYFKRFAVSILGVKTGGSEI